MRRLRDALRPRSDVGEFILWVMVLPSVGLLLLLLVLLIISYT